MRSMISVLFFGLVCSAGTALAQPSPSADDFAQAMKDSPCAAGQLRDNGGVCQAAVAGTRGFNLGARARMRRTPNAGGRAAPAAITAAAPSALDDLRITFHSGSAEMTPEGKAEAKNFADALMMPWLAKRRFEIAGHTDASGSKRKNLVLSQARAEAVVKFLVATGVDRSRLDAKGYGSEHLATPNAPLSAANRRVEARSLN